MATADVRARVPAKRRGIRREHLLFLAFVGPNFFLLAAFSYWPLIYQAYLSLTRWDMISPVKTFVGLDNYRYMFSAKEFYEVVFNTVYFTVSILIGSIVLGLALAMLLNQRLRWRVAGRATVFAPYVLSGAAIGLVWAYIFDPVYGLMRVFLSLFGIASPDWLVNTSWAMPAIIIVYLWKNVGYSAVIYLAGLQSIPSELYEAATVDGAGTWQSFWNITVPQLSPVTFFVSVTTILFSIQAFDIIAVMTEGGPVNATTTLVWYLYEQGFVAFRSGIAAAVGMLLFVVMLVVTFIQMRYAQRNVHYS